MRSSQGTKCIGAGLGMTTTCLDPATAVIACWGAGAGTVGECRTLNVGGSRATVSRGISVMHAKMHA